LKNAALNLWKIAGNSKRRRLLQFNFNASMKLIGIFGGVGESQNLTTFCLTPQDGYLLQNIDSW